MQIKVAEHAGFCFGVTNAVRTAYRELEEAKKSGRDIYCLGQLIHNSEETGLLESMGLKTVNSINDVPDGSRVIIRAHGEPDETYRLAEEKNIDIADATCPLVSRIHDIARKAGSEGRVLVVTGDKDHPEVRGILGSVRGSAYAVKDSSELEALAERIEKDLGKDASKTGITLCAQTTLNHEVFDECASRISQYFTDVEVCDTICSATRKRQDAAAELAEASDLMIVIGDPVSSNSVKLYEICKKHCKNAIFVQNSDNIFLHDLQKYCK